MAASHDTPLRVAVIGGGIGGLFAALALHHHCKDRVQIDVYEQASEYKEIGAGIGIGVNAAKLFHKIGLGQQLNAIAGDRNGIWITFRRHDTGDEIVTPLAADQGEVRQAPCSRSDLLDLLRSAVETRHAATLHTRKRYSHLTDHNASVTIHFSDSPTAQADLVVGADGIHSAVRAQFEPDKPVFSGRVAYRGIVPIAAIAPWWDLPSYSAMYCGPGRHFLVFPIARNTALNVVAFNDVPAGAADDVEESWVSSCDRKEVEDAYRSFCEPVQKLIALMPDRPGRWKINDREPLHSWRRLDGKVVLLGDAAHAMLPHLGAGAGQAVEDGWVLGRVVAEFLDGRFADLDAAPGVYEAVRRPRAQEVQVKARGAGMMYNLVHPSMEGKSHEERLGICRDVVSKQMRFVWEAELDQIYDDARKAGGVQSK